MTYPEAIEYLYGLRVFGAKLGLENTRKLAALAGNPQDSLRFIHVAGTNGKGSACAMLESICRHAGLRTGLFTSPHLIAFGERIQVNRQLVSEADIIRLLAELQPLLGTFPLEAHPTFFEVVTIMALRHFAEQGCEVVIWETGLGGRLDATNIVTPLASVITNVQFDHERWLGSTLAQIASEKAGIIKPGVPAIAGECDAEAIEVIVRAARDAKAPLIVVSKDDAGRPPLDEIALPLPGSHQKINAAIAVAAVRTLRSVLPASDDAIRAGLEQAQWAGRFQIVRMKPGQAIVLDGAHNPAGAETLASALRQYFPAQKITLIFGVFSDKAWNKMCRILMPLAQTLRLAPVQSDRSTPPESLAVTCGNLNPAARVEIFDSLGAALQASSSDALVVVTGSLHFVGEALEWLGRDSTGRTGERGLNEWQMRS